MKQIKLNGWQRLWAMVSIVYLLILISLGVIFFNPLTKSSLEHSWVYELIDTIKGPNQLSYQIRDAYKDMSDGEVIAKITQKYGSAEERERLGTQDPFVDLTVQGINKKYELKTKSFRQEQLKYFVRYVFQIVMLFFLVISFLYFVGLGVGWVAQGFRG